MCVCVCGRGAGDDIYANNTGRTLVFSGATLCPSQRVKTKAKIIWTYRPRASVQIRGCFVIPVS